MSGPNGPTTRPEGEPAGAGQVGAGEGDHAPRVRPVACKMLGGDVEKGWIPLTLLSAT